MLEKLEERMTEKREEWKIRFLLFEYTIFTVQNLLNDFIEMIRIQIHIAGPTINFFINTPEYV